MNLLFLTNNLDVTRPVLDFLVQREAPDRVLLWDQPITMASFAENHPCAQSRFIVSYAYRHLIDAQIVRHYTGRIINLHISLLPWNRGSDPNFWSFFQNTPQGVTIHEISAELDKGNILLQKEMNMLASEETFRTSYAKLHHEIQTLFINNWESLRSGAIQGRAQTGRGSYHSQKQLQQLVLQHAIDWDEKIDACIERINAHTLKTSKTGEDTRSCPKLT